MSLLRNERHSLRSLKAMVAVRTVNSLFKAHVYSLEAKYLRDLGLLIQ